MQPPKVKNIRSLGRISLVSLDKLMEFGLAKKIRLWS